MLCIGWGGNEFTPLLTVYRERVGYSQVDVDVFLGAYIFGLIPGLLLASPLADRYGRRASMIGGLLASMAGSLVLALGSSLGAGVLVGGRLLSGAAVGVAMAVGTAWVGELSGAPHDLKAKPGTGARRASVALTLGFAVGPGAAGVLAQWGPAPLVLPFLLHATLATMALIALVAYTRETHTHDRSVGLLNRLRVQGIDHPRFRSVVLPLAPWIFGSAAVAYAIIPQVVSSHVDHWQLLFATGLTVITLVCGVAVQPFARRLDSRFSARASVTSMVLMSTGIAGAALTALTGSPALAVFVAILLGSAYGIAIISGLLEIQRMSQPENLAGVIGVYYCLAYVGFLLPAILATLAHWLNYPEMLAGLAVIAAICTAVIRSGSRQYLPTCGRPAPARVSGGRRGHHTGTRGAAHSRSRIQT